jgi:2-C-methyl-D-erythritol 4-phosphate cytidylyltransferase/2-C-methyl-D-erythritol 2,4-cyclodiphosphate synthase
VTGGLTQDGVDAIVVAAGSSRRMGGQDKLAVAIDGRPLLAWTVEALARSRPVERIVVVVGRERVSDLRTMIGPSVTSVVGGGKRRHESVAAGLDELVRLDAIAGPGAVASARERIVLVHDGARPLVSAALVASVVAAARRYGAAIPCLPVSETVKRVVRSRVEATIDRAGLVTAQTPQGARRGLLLDAFERFPAAGAESWSDEAALLEACGIAVRVVPGEPENRKVTVPEDLAAVARSLGQGRLRVGIGRDSHPFGPAEPLVLCGVEIPGAPRLHGHSDGDVALHAVADAILGAAGLPDLGRQFPADGSTPAGVASTVLLVGVVELAAAAGWRPTTADVTILGVRPRLSGHLDRMRDGLADALGVDRTAVSVKASSGNLSGDEGAGRSMSALAIVSLGPA